MIRTSTILFVAILFGSMWLHGAFAMPMPDGEHGAMPSCLEVCLSMVHTDTANEASMTGATAIPRAQTNWGQVVNGEFLLTPPIESHHDPGRILTTIQRE